MKSGDLIWFLACTLLPACAISLALGYLVRRWAPRWNLVDEPGGRKVHSRATALGGGLAIFLGVALPFAMGFAVLWLGGAGEGAPIASSKWLPDFVRPHLAGLWHQAEPLWILLAAGGVLVLIGLADDRYRIDWKPRLLVQIGVAAFCVYVQKWQFTAFLNMPTLSALLSLLWIVTLVNAFNMLDNMDGLSSGVAILIAGTLAAVLLTPQLETAGPQLFVAGFLFVLAGSLLGFLWHNRPQARLFMGDAGSYFIGFSIAVATMLATYTNYQSPQHHTLLVPVCVMAVPLYDLISVVCIRLARGHSPFQPDRSHFSHRLVDLGMTRTQAVLTVYLTTATCCLAALLLPRVDTTGAAIIVVLVACVLLLVAILEMAARRKLMR